jgi:hypothetical protein
MLPLCIAASIAVAPFFTSSAQRQDQHLVLELQPRRSIVARRDGLEIEVRLRNVGTRPAIIYPWFVAEPLARVDPQLTLRFQVRDGSGQIVEAIPEKRPGRPARLVAGSLAELYPHYFIGAVVSLSGGAFAHRIQAAGTYHIRASCRSEARTWLRSEIGSGRGKLDDVGSGYSKDQEGLGFWDWVFEGELESEEIVLTVE